MYDVKLILMTYLYAPRSIHWFELVLRHRPYKRISMGDDNPFHSYFMHFVYQRDAFLRRSVSRSKNNICFGKISITLTISGSTSP